MPVPAPSPPRRRRFPTCARGAVAILISAAAIWFLVIPQFTDAEASFVAIRTVSIPLVLAAVAFQVLSLLSSSVLTGLVLGWGRVRFTTLIRIDLSDLTVNHITPAGAAVAGAVHFRLLMAEGLGAREAISAVAVQVSLANLALTAVFLRGAVLSLVSILANPGSYILAAVTVVIVVAAVVVAAWMLTRRTDRALRLARALGRRIPLPGEERLARFIETIVRPSTARQ